MISTTVTPLYQEVGKHGYMDPSDFSALRRELVYQEFMIHYLQEEQKKRWEELRALERDLEKLQADPKYQQLLKLVEKMKNEPVAEQVRARRSRAKRATRSAGSGRSDGDYVNTKGVFFPK